MRVVLSLIFALALAPVASAQPTTAYYGAAFGTFEYQEDDFDGTPLFYDEASSYRLMVGYQFSEHLWIEGGYGKTGTLRDSATLDFLGTPFTIDFASEFQILTVRLLGVLPFENGITLLGGIGYAEMKQDITIDINGSGPQSDDVNGGEPTLFAGVQYDWERFALRIGYEKYNFDGGVDGTETSVGFFYKL